MHLQTGIKAVILGVLLSGGLSVKTTLAHDKPIYKCQKNGAVHYTEEKCSPDAKPLQLKQIAAPLKPIELRKLEAFEADERIRVLENRIELRQLRVKQLVRQMNSETRVLEQSYQSSLSSHPARKSANSRKPKVKPEQPVNNDDFAARGRLAEQIIAVTYRYRTLIGIEEARIRVLLNRVHIEQARQGSGQTPQ